MLTELTFVFINGLVHFGKQLESVLRVWANLSRQLTNAAPVAHQCLKFPYLLLVRHGNLKQVSLAKGLLQGTIIRLKVWMGRLT